MSVYRTIGPTLVLLNSDTSNLIRVHKVWHFHLHFIDFSYCTVRLLYSNFRLITAFFQGVRNSILLCLSNLLLQLRKILCDILCSHYKVFKRVFVKKIEAESGVSPSDNDCKTVLRVSCLFKDTIFFLYKETTLP